MEQTYQEVAKIVAEDLKKLRTSRGFDTLGEVNKKLNVQKYFYDLKSKYPEKYERLMFDTNGHEPFSKDLEEILSDFRVCGILKTKYDILPE